MPSKYGIEIAAPKNSAQRDFLCGWAGPEAADAAMSAIVKDGPDAGRVFGDTFFKFALSAVPDGGFTGAGKTVRGWDFFRKATGQEPDLTPQPTGNCFVRGSMVLMADGSERPIESIRVGEWITAPSGAHRRVLRVRERDYVGDVVTINTALGRRSITATPDHQFQWFADDNSGSQFVSDKEAYVWKAIGNIVAGDRLHICSPHRLAMPVLDVMRREGFAGQVFCLQVDTEHAFICNGYAVHNCVAAATDDVLELTQSVQICHGDSAEFQPIYNPYHYATGRVLVGGNRLRGGAGSLGSWQAKACELYGSIPVQPGLPEYSTKNVDAWGDDKAAEGKTFRDYMDEGKKHIIRTTADVSKAWEKLRDGLAAGHFATIASNRGYKMKPDADGFHVPSGNWGHQLSIWGYCDSGSNPWVAIKNQWGDVHTGLKDFETGEPWPKGFLRVRLADFIKYHLTMSGAETFLYSGYDGFPVLTWSSEGMV